MAEPKISPPDADADLAVTGATPGEARAESIRRIQVGATGLFAMVLVMGVASAISNRAQVAEDRAVPDAAPTTEPTDTPDQVDPLADAGVVPVVRDEDEEADGAAEERTTVPDIEPSGRPSAPARTNAPSRN